MKFHIAFQTFNTHQYVVLSFLSSLISVRNMCWNESLTFQSHTSSKQIYYHSVHSPKTCSIDSFYACDVTIIAEKKYPSLKHILYWCKYSVLHTSSNFLFQLSLAIKIRHWHIQRWSVHQKQPVIPSSNFYVMAYWVKTQRI